MIESCAVFGGGCPAALDMEARDEYRWTVVLVDLSIGLKPRSCPDWEPLGH